mmetsp:Transcript_32653/g.55063  ORF Transcript_32653/g.55063 Transcript_32653/m.55063 type:complete len:356 (+) Transcript_32653:102-1169(+)
MELLRKLRHRRAESAAVPGIHSKKERRRFIRRRFVLLGVVLVFGLFAALRESSSTWTISTDSNPDKFMDDTHITIQPRTPIFPSIALVVHFTWPPHAGVFAKLFFLYGHVFGTIAFCGRAPDFPVDPSIVFFSCDSRASKESIHGALMYKCFAHAATSIKFTDKITSILFTNDDVVLNYWNFDRLSTDSIWFPDLDQATPTLYRQSLSGPVDTSWQWHKPSIGLDAYKQAVASMSGDYRTNLLSQNKFDLSNVAIGAVSDLIHIPLRLRHSLLELCDLFTQNEVFLEIAVPAILLAVEPYERWEKLNGRYLDYNEREDIVGSYSESMDFLHPVYLFEKNGENHFPFVKEIFVRHV